MYTVPGTSASRSKGNDAMIQNGVMCICLSSEEDGEMGRKIWQSDGAIIYNNNFTEKFQGPEQQQCFFFDQNQKNGLTQAWKKKALLPNDVAFQHTKFSSEVYIYTTNLHIYIYMLTYTKYNCTCIYIYIYLCIDT